MKQITFSVPARMQAKEIADTFAAYLLGAKAFLNQSGQHGPFPMPVRNMWQLDEDNLFKLHILGDGMAKISCKHVQEVATMEILVALFQDRHRSEL